MRRPAPKSERGGSGRPCVALGVEKLEARDLPDAAGNSAFVTQAYRDLLSRAPDPGGLAFYSGALDRNALTRTGVALALESSPEGRGDQVQGLYSFYLNRAADPGGLAAFS